MTTPTPTPHVRIDPRFGFSILTEHNPERDLLVWLAATGQHDKALARINAAAAICEMHIENREVALLLRETRSIREQAV